MTPFTVALDLGKKKHAVSIYHTQTNELSHSMTIQVNQKGFTQLHTALTRCSTQPSDFIIGCEATGHYGDTVIRSLQAQNYPVVRMNPAQVTQFRRGLGRRAKTDALDADAMTRQLAVGNFVPDHQLSDTAMKLRRLTRLRLGFIEERGRWMNRLSAVINQMFPEVEPLLTGLNTPTTLAILTAYPSRKRLANASLKKLTSIIHRASRRNKGKEYAQTLKEAATVSIGLDDPCLEMELSILLNQIIAKNQSVHDMDKQIREVTDQLLAERSQELDLERPLQL